MGKKTFCICLSVIVTLVLAMVLTAWRFPPRTEWDVCYEMTNSRITWDGAGYNGIYTK